MAAVQTREHHMLSCGRASKVVSQRRPLGGLGDVRCPGYRSIRLHTVYKQSWAFSGFLFCLDMSGLFSLIKNPVLLVPLHNCLLSLYCPDHIPTWCCHHQVLVSRCPASQGHCSSPGLPLKCPLFSAIATSSKHRRQV